MTSSSLPFRLRRADRRDEAALPDGRRLAWSEWGPSDGRVVLLCTGAATSGSLGLDADAVDALGVRLVGLDRPGLGRSTHDPARTLTSFATDVTAAARAAGWRRPVAVGFSQGAPFALALGASGVVDRVAVVSGQDDLAEHLPTLDDHLRGLVEAIHARPDAVEQDVVASTTADWFLTMVDTTSGEADRAVYRDPDFSAAFTAAVREALAPGAAGYARDLVTAMGPWPFRPEDVLAHVDLWYGALDESPVHSPDHGARLAVRLPHADRRVVPGEGGSLLWTRSREILTALLV